ncbi:hypothetical protein ACFVYJ_12380 [Pontibacter sp. JAM-7]|uniref:hypothetical protein n=1 Tax=Pontibacter sp. JAM-7 TaxID=3366581 RepID=UPI003AF9C14A
MQFMTEDQLHCRLFELSIEQLEQLEQRLLERIEEKKITQQTRKLVPPQPGNNLELMASDLGLDISRLMKEVKKRSR